MRRLGGLVTAPFLAALSLAPLQPAPPLAAAGLEVSPGSAALGLFGLDVILGSTCASPDEVTLVAPPATIGGDFEACRVLAASGVEVTAAAFVAGEAIVLGPGFAVPPGASFSAVTDELLPGTFASVSSEAPSAERSFNVRFHLRLDQLALAEGEEVEHLRALDAAGGDVFRVILRRQAGENVLALGARQDGGGEILTPAGQEVSLPAGWNQVELEWRAGAGDGRLMVSLNEGTFVGLADLANSLSVIESFLWGAVDGSFAGTPGRLEVDGFTAWR